MKKIAITTFLLMILCGSIASAEQLATFDNPQIYVSPPTFVQLESNLFKIPNTNIDIELANLCPENDPNLIVTDKADVAEKIVSDNVVDPNSVYLVNNSYYEFCFKIGIKKINNGQLIIYPRALDSTIKLAKPSYDNKPIIISGLVFDGENVGLAVNFDVYLLLHNITIDKSKKGIELSCSNGCLVTNSKLTGVPESPPAFSTGIKTQGKGVTIDDVTISNFDIGIYGEGENILIEESIITNNKLYGIRADADVKNLTLSKVSLYDNGGGIEAEKAFILEEGANSNIGMIDSQLIKDKPTFILPQSASSKDNSIRYVEIYEAGDDINQKQNQLKAFRIRYDLKDSELTKGGDAITISDPAIQRKYVMATYTGPSGSTRSTTALWTRGNIVFTSIDQVEVPSGGSGMNGVGEGSPTVESVPEGQDIAGNAFSGGASGAKAMSCSLTRDSTDIRSMAVSLMFFILFIAILFVSARRMSLHSMQE
ncbi:MAG: right-handed parallel beta-helix repeat-containing protein [Pseudomonadota bacterium]